jgi:DNA-binding NarL/FixJ family response regulator
MRILIVDDHPVMRSGIRVCLRDLDSTIDFVEAADLQEAVHAIKADASIDLVLFDLTLPGVSGVESLIAFREAVDPCPPVVVFSGTDDAATVAAALDAGAMGFIPKTSTPAILQTALQLVLAKGIYVPPSILERHASPRAKPTVSMTRPLRKLSELGLTPRQQEVCALMVKGRAVKQIARELSISPATVKAHLQPILRNLGVMNRTEAIVALHRLGFSLETQSTDAV